MKKYFALLSTVMLTAALSCSGGDEGPTLPLISVDTDRPEPADVGIPDEKAQRVEVNLDEHVADSGAGVSVYQLGDLPEVSGPVVTGRPGDWVLENDVARFVVEGDKRAMSPCPWGGTTIDAAYLADGSNEDILGEICMMTNGGLSFRPETFETIRNGASGGAAILAASGALEINDFINLRAMIDDFVDGLSDRIQLEINVIPPLRVTVYYILNPGENRLRIVSAFRNDGDEQVDLLPIYLVASGGDGFYFNPLSGSGGFGAGDSSFGIGIENLPFQVFNGDTASYAFVPEPIPGLDSKDLPIGGSSFIISGVTAALLGAPSNRLIQILTSTKEQIAAAPDIKHLAPGDVDTVEHSLIAGSGSISSVVDVAFEAIGQPTAPVAGRVVDGDGNAVAGARVSAMFDGIRTMNQTISGADGTFAMQLPPASYEFVARNGAMAPDGAALVVVDQDGVSGIELGVLDQATIRVRVTTPDDGCPDTSGAQPVPARLMVICPDGPCANQPTLKEADVEFHRKPANVATIVYGGRDGILEATVPAGEYRIVVSRGIEWSMWPYDARTTGGQLVQAEGGETYEFDAEIAQVINTGDAVSGDFHIHSISSPDSPVPRVERVLNFAAEGVDVMVSTDHDFISDYAPYITELGLNDWTHSIVGEEVTTADLGHFNAFPLTQDLTHSRGGSIDWGGGDSYTLLPEQLYAAINEYPGEQVIQVNHAAGLGLIKFTTADVLRGITYADREAHRLPPQDSPGKTPEDTGIWSDDFTAMELMNGNSRSRFYRLARWWMTMIGRGFSPTGTAVTDTHKLYGDLGGVPRTYVFGAGDRSCGARPFAELDDSDGFISRFSEQVNRGDAIGTNGPFFTVAVTNGAGERVGLGETVAADSETVATLDLQLPEWMDVDVVDVYLNPELDDVLTRPGEIIETAIPPTSRVQIALDAATDLETVTVGAVEHRVWKKSVEIPLSTDEDAFVIFVLRGSQDMWPLVRTSAFAFSNPVYLDADGNGYDNPPYAAAASVPPGPGELRPCLDSFCGTKAPLDPNQVTPQEFIDAMKHADCRHHEGHAH